MSTLSCSFSSSSSQGRGENSDWSAAVAAAVAAVAVATTTLTISLSEAAAPPVTLPLPTLDSTTAATTSDKSLGKLNNIPPPRPDLPIIPLDEVADHCDENSLWYTFRGAVYDLTFFINGHPGGTPVSTKFFGVAFCSSQVLATDALH
jgi:hypothetical protein